MSHANTTGGSRLKEGEDAEVRGHMGNADGRDPEAVRDELETVRRISASDVISVEDGSGHSLIRVNGTVLPTALEAIHLPVAQFLTNLQVYTAPTLVMPSIPEISDSQLGYLSLLTSIYGGTAHQWTWTEVTLKIPDDQAGRERSRAVIDALLSGQHLVKVESAVNPAGLRPGGTLRLVPGSDAAVTTAKLVDWIPEII